MNILVIGGTRFFGIPMVNKLCSDGHNVTIATRGQTPDNFGSKVSRVKLNIYDSKSVKDALKGKQYDIVIDKMGYGSLDIKNILESVTCSKLIHMSTAGVYHFLDHPNISESEFNPNKEKLLWCTRGDLGYDEEKRTAESALSSLCSNIDWVSVRSPVVFGKNDYTNRLLFYIRSIIKEIPMNINNLDSSISWSYSEELADFFLYLVNNNNIKGAVNCCSKGVLSIREIIEIIEETVNKKAIFSENGENAPFNGMKSFSLDVSKAENAGFKFSYVTDWIYDLIKWHISQEAI